MECASEKVPHSGIVSFRLSIGGLLAHASLEVTAWVGEDFFEMTAKLFNEVKLHLHVAPVSRLVGDTNFYILQRMSMYQKAAIG